MSNDMFPDSLVEYIKNNPMPALFGANPHEANGGMEAIMAKSRADALYMQQQQFNVKLAQMEHTFSIALDEVMQDILQKRPELRKHETVIRRMAMDTNPADLKGAITALNLAAEHVRRKLMEEPKGIFRVLFIGGPRDGQWHAVEQVIPILKVAVTTPWKLGEVLPKGTPNIPWRTEEYRLMKLGTNASDIYVHESVSNSEVIDHLLAGYKGAMENSFGTD